MTCWEQGLGEGVFTFGLTGDDIRGETLDRHLGRGE